MFLPSPSGLGGSLLPVALVGIQARGFSLRANGEALRSTLTNEGLVHISLIEALGDFDGAIGTVDANSIFKRIFSGHDRLLSGVGRHPNYLLLAFGRHPVF